MGRTTGPDAERPLHWLADGKPDGARSADGRVAGTYVHGLFVGDRHRAEWLRGFGAETGIDCHDALVDRILDDLAGHLEQHVAIDRLIAMAR